MRAYHFVGKTLRDGRPIPPDEEWLIHDGPLEMCVSGLHASLHPFDALTYAPGSTLCLVDIEAEPASAFLSDTDKVCGNRRRIVKRIDAEPLLREFARWCALSVIHLWNAPDIVRRYLETGDESLRDAAREAAGAAAREVAWAALRAAARAAARDAAWAAAGAAAWDAAWDAAREAAGAAAWDAAWDAAREAAWDAARDAQRTKFSEMVDAAFAEVAD